MFNDTTYSNFTDKLPKKVKAQFQELLSALNMETRQEGMQGVFQAELDDLLLKFSSDIPDF